MISYSYLSTDKFFDAAGEKFAGTKFSKGELNTYAEYGLNADWTVGGALSLQSVSNNGTGGNVSDLNTYRPAYAEAFARTAIFDGDNYIISIEPRLKLAIDANTGINPEGNAPIPELKFSYGQAYTDEYNSFSDISVTYRHRSESALDDMLKFEATAGSRPFTETPLLFLAQSFFEKNLGSIATGSSSGNYDLLKLQLSAAYEYDDNITVQAGYFHNLYGVNTAAI